MNGANPGRENMEKKINEKATMKIKMSPAEHSDSRKRGKNGKRLIIKDPKMILNICRAK